KIILRGSRGRHYKPLHRWQVPNKYFQPYARKPVGWGKPAHPNAFWPYTVRYLIYRNNYLRKKKLSHILFYGLGGYMDVLDQGVRLEWHHKPPPSAYSEAQPSWLTH